MFRILKKESKGMFPVIKNGLSVRQALLLFFSVSVMIPLIFFMFLYSSQLANYLRQIENEAAMQIVSNNADQLRSIVERISYTAASICNNRSILKNINTVVDSPESSFGYLARDTILMQMRSISASTLYGLNPKLYLVSSAGQIITLDYTALGEKTQPPQYQDYFEQDRVMWDNILSPGEMTNFNSTWPIYNSQKKIVAYLVIVIPETDFWDALSHHPLLEYQQQVYSRGELIATNATEPSEVDKTTVLHRQMENWGIELVVTIPTQVYFERSDSQMSLFAVYFLALSAFLLVIIGVLSNYITQPLLLAVRQLQNIREGDYSVSNAKSWIKEIAGIRGNLNDVAVHIDELIRDVREESRLREKLYYESLMAQINPHFLYNSLNSIKWISTLNGNTLAADMLGKLGNILHYSFDSNQYSISIGKEITFLNDYVAMLQLRYGNSIDFSVEIDPSLYPAAIPRFCLQPLIENAFMHGLFSRPGGRIVLSAAVDGDQLTLTVADDGVGMDEQTAALALSGDPGRKMSGTGIGLPNVHNRIQLLYGSRFGLRIVSKPEEGCRIDVALPFLKEQT